jgi:kinetochore protein Spc7/SPC105
MEFTTGIGGIHHSPDNTFDDCANNEDMSMEFTTVMGGVIGQQKRQSVSAARRQTLHRVSDADSTMDMTMSVGRILSNQSENGEIDEDEATLGMDITAAFGGILSSEPQGRRSLGKKIMMEEANKPNSPDKAIFAAVSKPSPKRRSSQASATETPNATSAGLLPFRGKPSDENTPRAKTKTPSPRKLLTPQQSVEQPGRITRQSQSRSPHGASIRRRSPRKSTMSPAKSPVSNTRSPEKQQSSPRKGLSNLSTPQPRRLSGIGADKPGLGSPRIVEVFDRRSSIGDSAPKFVPGNRLVSFDDPKAMSNEVDNERQNEGEKESTLNFREARFDLPREDEEATLNLRGMIDRMSPQRKPLQGRKSLHVGSAKGLLGKRPAELDENEDEWEENDGVKRLRGRQSSPVKNIKLQQPYDTYSKPIQPPQINLNPSFSSPLNSGQAMTPKERRLKNMKTNHTVHDVNFDRTSQGTNRDGREEESIHLQDFLNMISIRFMELVTTKRRHTTAPTTGPNGAVVVGEDGMSLERCVVASACTVPMLELYQHSCRELKKYIAEGRRMVKEIEADTLEDNPPLFQEYLSATPDVKALMDNQFKNVKTHARLLSKAMWYEWRMKLQEGLKEGVIKISHDMDNDYSVLQEQLDILDTVVPDLLTKYAELEAESGILEEAAQEIADCDPTDLQAARDELVELGEDIDAKKELLESLRKEFKAAEDEVDALATKKSTYLANIEQSEKIRESCRGWSSSEINQMKGKVPHSSLHLATC